MKVKKATLNPIWDQTLIFNDIIIYGSEEFVKQHPPTVILLVMDQDFCVSTEIDKHKDKFYGIVLIARIKPIALDVRLLSRLLNLLHNLTLYLIILQLFNGTNFSTMMKV